MTKPSPVDRQREHQANERTFLAWLRTSISLIGFGFAIARFGLFLRQIGAVVTGEPGPLHPVAHSETLGVCLVILGVIVIVLAAWRYNQVFWQIEQANFRPNRWAVWLMTGVVAILGIVSLPLLLVRATPTLPRSSPDVLPNSSQRSSLLYAALKQFQIGFF